MGGQTRISFPTYGLLPSEADGFDSLAELALDLRWSWNHATDHVWRQLDPGFWQKTHNPWSILQIVSRDRVEEALADPAFRANVEALMESKRHAEGSPAWFQQHHSQAPLTCIAYFSMEFMLSEALPIYSGGLGNVAGDQLKTASDLGIPVVGLGLLFQRGYFHQVIDRDGAQQAVFPYNDPSQLPVTPLRRPNGEWLRVVVDMPGGPVWLRTWQVQVGRTRLYLLDSNDAANLPEHRGITSELYGGGVEMRLKQEMVLGIGGWRLITALGLRPEVCHLNEGHAALAVLERAHGWMLETGQAFDAALAITRAGNLFTTHTAVVAGFDRYDPGLVAQYLRGYAERELAITMHELMALGRRDPSDDRESFNMAYLATRGSGAITGVSRLHGQVSRRLFGPLFPRWPTDEVPIGHVTNGVHAPTWDSDLADALWTRACGKDRWRKPTETMASDIRQVSDGDLWEFRNAARKSLVEFIRRRHSQQLAASGASAESMEKAKDLFDPKVLTLGFARRFATYKRPTLLLRDQERLVRLLANADRPVQLIIAGKAHPADVAGQDQIRQWTRFIQRPEVRDHVVFLTDYDMLMAEHLVQGVDVWINTPQRPWEACGTSGMKVLVNGGLNLSELDGWWAEAYSPEVGWALGDGLEHGEDQGQDAIEGAALYGLLEREVVPAFYVRTDTGVPPAWVSRIRESMALLTARFSANRSVREYTERFYLPGADAYLLRSADGGRVGHDIVAWRERIGRSWSALRFGEVHVVEGDGNHHFTVHVDLDLLTPEMVLVELCADDPSKGRIVRVEMQPIRGPDGRPGAYTASVSAIRPASDYTARITPRHASARCPLDDARILWQR